MHEYLSEEDFRKLIDEVFAPFLSTLGFRLAIYKTTNIWRFAEFAGHDLAIRVMYEFPMHYADVQVQTLSDLWRRHTHQGTTLTLSAMRAEYSGRLFVDGLGKEQHFAGIDFESSEAKRLFLMAKQLRLVLPRWMQDNRAV